MDRVNNEQWTTNLTSGPIFEKSYDNLRIFSQYTLILRQTYDNRKNNLNIVNITEYINVNIKMSSFTSSREIIGKYVMPCNNVIIQTF